jgi:arginyl-tRNA synthetase
LSVSQALKQQLEQLVRRAIMDLQAEGFLSAASVLAQVQVTRTKNKQHGDFASNVALLAAKAAGRPPRELAEAIAQHLPANDALDRIEIAGPGFINFYLKPIANQAIIADILAMGANYGRNQIGVGRKVLVEFVSANPTGPLHVGHGRQAALGDTIATLLEAIGWSVTREFYYNDAGSQIENLGLSVQVRLAQLAGQERPIPPGGYHGEYIRELAQRYAEQHPNDPRGENLAQVTRFAVTELRKEQDLDLQAFDVRFDSYYLESSLYTEGQVEEIVRTLAKKKQTYEQDGALWLRTTDYGDDKDRVMRKRDGAYTYFVPDVAYHVTKWRRGFTHAINVQGADHHSTVMRVRAGLQALDIGIPEGYPEYVLHQMVTVVKGGEEVKISKRAGSYVTIRHLIDEVGRDAVRYFLLMRKSDSQLVFDVDLARSQSEDNPVYYVQYAHARICSVKRQLKEKGLNFSQAEGLAHVDRLNEGHEYALMERLARYSEAVEAAAMNREPHQLTHYLHRLANDFHTYYNAHQFLVDDDALRSARLALILATRQVIANGLRLLGVSTPARM